MSESLPPNLMSCAQCDAELPADGTNGLCPACLMAEAMKPSGPKKAWEPPTAEELAPHFPPYEIQRILGRGGMGAVYLARQISLNRLVAIKILPADLGDCDMGFAERFKNEAQAMAQLSHPGIVAVFDFGETEVGRFVPEAPSGERRAGDSPPHQGLLYIVMEYIEGTDVQQMVAQQGRLHSAHAMAITAHVCDALAYAHSRGIIHRDIKPSNIMVSSEGVVKVADFGLAKMDQGGQTASLTRSGMAMGTLHFMAPESLTLGSAVDQRADIYAVGVMLYQMLTGKLPQGLFEMPSFQVPGLDPRYDGIVAKALREDRDVRYQQAYELRYDLDAILTQPVVKVEPEAEQAPAAVPPPSAKPQRPAGQPYRPPPHSAPPPPKKKSSTGLILSGLALLVLIAAGVFFFVGERTTTQPALATKDQPFVNSLGMKLVPVPETNVLFCIHETRYKDYAAYAAEAQGVDGAWENQTHDGYVVTERREEHPVMTVSWEDAQRFCAWLSKKEGKLYRLPTDEEWSYAVGIGQDEKRKKGTLPSLVMQVPHEFPWGVGFPPKTNEQAGNYSDPSRKAKAPGAGGQYLNGYDDGFPTTAPVMSFKPNKHGLHDLGGNVWEWCEDWYDNTQKTRVLRGAAWGNYERDHMLSSHRAHLAPGLRFDYHGRCGFRVVLELNTNTAQPPTAANKSDTLGDPPNTTRRVVDLIKTANLLPAPHLDTWDVKGTDLEFLKGGEIVFPHACGTQEYDLEFEFTVLTDALNSISHLFPTAAGRCEFRLQLFREHPGPFWGFAILDNAHYAFANEARVVKDYPALFKAGQRYQTIIKVRDGSLEGYLDGRLLVHWEGDQSRFTTGENNLPHPRHPKFGIYDGRAIIHKATVTEFVSKAPPPPTSASILKVSATKDAPFVNTLGMKFVPVPGTDVLFCIHETRYQDYAAYAAVISGVDGTWKNQGDGGIMPTERPGDHPVMRVSWEDAQRFCAWLSQKEGKTYRLPTDAEWSIAVGLASEANRPPGTTPARLNWKDQTSFPWGGDYPPRTEDQAGNYSDESRREQVPREGASYVDSYEDGFPNTAPVMSFRPNPFGLYDLGGNVWEWCEDWWDQVPRDRVLRGGAWVVGDRASLLSSVRKHHAPNDRNRFYGGFRCVIEIDSQPTPVPAASAPKP